MRTKIDIAYARRLAPSAPPGDWSAVRDWVDGMSGSDLACVQLDLLTDWVTAERNALDRGRAAAAISNLLGC